MATYWGVDSATPANATPSQLNGETVYDYVHANFGTPVFWGRYIGGNFALTSGEVSYLHGKGCKILVIYNGATSTSVSGTYQDGVNDANNAISAANALGVAAGVCIFADIESGWSPSAAWIQGWSDTMFGTDYRGAGGVYANTFQSQFLTPYCEAWNADSKMQDGPSFVYATEPEPGCTSGTNPPARNAVVQPDVYCHLAVC